ncbi:MAG: hypothetical protein ACP5JB_07995 [candidate division WOR-3 bacterium]|jgi:hypothetical protein
MWLVTTAAAAILSTIGWWVCRGRYRLGFLSLMLWGGVAMILVDFVLGYQGGPFIETVTGGLVSNATLLGLLMLVPVVLIWLVAVVFFGKAGKGKWSL